MKEKTEAPEGMAWRDQEDTPYEPGSTASTWVKEPSVADQTTGPIRSLDEAVTAIQSNLDRALEVLGSIERKLGACAG